jgi:PAS domain S-box-containing protein
MNSLSNPPRRAWHTRWIATVVLLLSLAVTGFAWWREQELARRDQVIQMQNGLARINSILMPLLGSRFETLHDAAAGAFRRGNVTPENWNAFLENSEWSQRFPGMIEVGYAERVPSAGGEDRFVVRYVSSKPGVASHTRGSDLSTERTVRAALDATAGAGYGIPSGEVTIHTPPTNAAIPCVVGLFPILAEQRRLGTPIENRQNTRGVVFFALNQREYFDSLKESLARAPLDLQLLPPGQTPPRTATSRPFTVTSTSGQWRFLATLRAAGHGEAVSHWLVLALGIGLSALLFYLFSIQARLRYEADLAVFEMQQRDEKIQTLNEDLERRITQRTSEFQDANARLKAQIVEREEAEAHLARFKALAEATSDLVAMVSLEGLIIYANQGGRKMIGLSERGKVEGRHYREFYSAETAALVEQTAIPVTRTEGSWKGEGTLVNNQGGEVPVSMVWLTLRGSEGQPDFLAVIHRDISDRRKFEETLYAALAEEKELSQLKSNFIAMVSHEIRTPLALILSSSEILSRYLDRLPAEKRQSHLEIINQSVHRMSALMEDVLLYSRAEAGRIEFTPVALDLESVCRRIVDETSSTSANRCPIKFEFLTEPDQVRGDETLLRHILGNLLSNAVKYSSEGVEVILRVTRESGEAVFEAIDRGVGIPKADQEKMFQPFHRGENVKNTVGTGLGLVIVRRCVERHGGSLSIQSDEQSGTIARVRLPMFSPAHTEFLKRFS